MLKSVGNKKGNQSSKIGSAISNYIAKNGLRSTIKPVSAVVPKGGFGPKKGQPGQMASKIQAVQQNARKNPGFRSTLK